MPDGVVRLANIDEARNGVQTSRASQLDEFGESEELLRAAAAWSEAALLDLNDLVQFAPVTESLLQYAGVHLSGDREERNRAIVQRFFLAAVLVNRHDDSTQPVERHFAAMKTS